MKIARVQFAHPVPIAGTHRREPFFDAEDGWAIERDEGGDFHVSGHGVDFWTDGSMSWVASPVARPVPAPAPPSKVRR